MQIQKFKVWYNGIDKFYLEVVKMANRICIPDYEYKERIARAAKLIQQKGLGCYGGLLNRV